MGGSWWGAPPRRLLRPGCRRRAPFLAVALAVVSPAFAACGGDDPGSATAPAATASSSTPTTSPSDPASATAEPTAAATPEPPKRPRAKNTTKGRKEFAVFVVRRWGHALATNDAGAVTGLAPKGTACQGCRDLRAELTKRRKQGWFVDFPGAEVKRVDVEPGEPGTWVATARISVPESTSYFDDGSYRNDNKAHPKVDFTVRMRHQAGRFVLLAFTVD